MTSLFISVVFFFVKAVLIQYEHLRVVHILQVSRLTSVSTAAGKRVLKNLQSRRECEMTGSLMKLCDGWVPLTVRPAAEIAPRD